MYSSYGDWNLVIGGSLILQLVAPNNVSEPNKASLQISLEYLDRVCNQTYFYHYETTGLKMCTVL